MIAKKENTIFIKNVKVTFETLWVQNAAYMLAFIQIFKFYHTSNQAHIHCLDCSINSSKLIRPSLLVSAFLI